MHTIEGTDDTNNTANSDEDLPEQWPHVASLRPQLQKHVSAHPQDFRGARWYILSDSAKGRHLRFNDTAYEFIGRLDGDQTVDEIYTQIKTGNGNDHLSRHDILSILTQLFSIDVLRSGLPADVEQLFNRSQAERQANRLKRLLNPLAIRFPLYDPDKLLNRTIQHVRPLFSITGLLLWLLVVGLATVLLLIHYQDLTTTLKQDIFAPRNIVLLFAMFPVMKAFHEFAHAFTVKTWGGEVHEMGITLLVLIPVPYVDASAAWAFREKYKRVLVSASGMIAELFLAAVAFIVWTSVEPGAIKDAALSAFLIGSVSTVLFNANPLLRFDGYYILQDLIEIPNLYTRAAKFNLYMLKRIVLGQTEVATPVTADSERKWLLVYGILAWIYRLFITLVIASFLAGKYLVLGIALAVWSLLLMFAFPVYRGIRYLLLDQTLTGNRTRAVQRTLIVSGFTAGVIALIPFSLYTNAQGVIWVPDQAQIYAKTDGFVRQLVTPPGTQVRPGTAILELDNPANTTRKIVLDSRHQELNARLNGERFADPIKADQTAEELLTLEADIASLQSEIESQTLFSKSFGTLVFPEDRNMTGRYIKKGQPVAYVVDPNQLIVRLVVPQTAVGLFSQGVNEVQVRLADYPSKIMDASIIRQTPAGSNSLPSRALGAIGGGGIAVVGSDKNGTTTAEKIFQIDLGLPVNSHASGLGTRVFVRINHGREVLARQWLRSIRQILLKTLPF